MLQDYSLIITSCYVYYGVAPEKKGANKMNNQKYTTLSFKTIVLQS